MGWTWDWSVVALGGGSNGQGWLIHTPPGVTRQQGVAGAMSLTLRIQGYNDMEARTKLQGGAPYSHFTCMNSTPL